MKPKIWIRTLDGDVKEIPKCNWQAHRARGAIRIERAVIATSETADIKLEPVRSREAAGQYQST